MTKKFKNKYRIASARAPGGNYKWNAACFITICAANREHFCGEIQNKKMVLSKTGVIADMLWYEIPNHVPFVELGEFVVMPNHVHEILILDKPVIIINNDNVMEDDNAVDNGNVEKIHEFSLRYRYQQH